MSSDMGQPVSDMANKLRKAKMDTERIAWTQALNKAQVRAIALTRKSGRKVVVVKGI